MPRSSAGVSAPGRASRGSDSVEGDHGGGAHHHELVDDVPWPHTPRWWRVRPGASAVSRTRVTSNFRRGRVGLSQVLPRQWARHPRWRW
jgi:hypothetical protein